MRKLGLNIGVDFGASVSETMELIKKAGFDTSFICWELDSNIKDIKRFADSIDLEIETLHAPFDDINCIWDADSNDGDYFIEMLKKCIWDAGENGIPYVIMHTTYSHIAPLSSRIGLTRIEKLVIEAMKSGVKLAFENLEFPRFMHLILDYFKNDSVGFCYDVGHENCFTPGLSFLPQLSDRLFCTHIHDNFGYRDDLHRIPFDCDLDFEKVCKKIKASGYEGSLMLEVGKRADCSDYSLLTTKEFIERAYAAALKLRKLTDGE